MKRIMIITLLSMSLILGYFYKKRTSSYIIISMPIILGTKGYEAGNKFPRCIMNPIRTEEVKKEIIYYLENIDYFKNAKDIEQYNIRNINYFFNSLDNISDFDIVSFITDEEMNFPNKEPLEAFLLQAKNSDKMLAVYRNIKNKEILLFRITL